MLRKLGNTRMVLHHFLQRNCERSSSISITSRNITSKRVIINNSNKLQCCANINEKNDKFYRKFAFPMCTKLLILGLKAEKKLRN